MSSTKENFIEFIKVSDLDSADKELWQNFIDFTPIELIEPIWEVLASEPEHLTFFTENLKQKLEIKPGINKSYLDKIVKQENDYLKQATKNYAD